jgi:hypothetical protein
VLTVFTANTSLLGVGPRSFLLHRRQFHARLKAERQSS